MYQVLLNPLSNNGKGVSAADELKEIFKDEKLTFNDITKFSSAADLCKNFAADDVIIVSGGDGTVSNFVNDVYEMRLQQKIYLYCSGSGNDFMNDVSNRVDIKNRIIPLNDFMQSLPTVTVNGSRKYFINGIGYGIDGYCCEEGDRIRSISNKPVNYTTIALKGVFGKYKTRNATVTVDGVTKSYKKVWLAPAMLGRFYGGGMMIAPGQDRLNKEKTLTIVVCHDLNPVRLLTIFPSIFKGNHVKHTDVLDFITGHKVKVEFDVPCALQIDGETILNVKSYEAEYE